ncbi:MAG: FAD binding domain-containing protein [Anaerolineae bacterium]|nr:FAD binding domain-containing protein [Anaerolineae bacterium]
MVWSHYLIAESVSDALDKLASFDGEARLIAGGTDLVLQAQRGQCPSTSMVDVTRIPGLNQISEQDGYIAIGATVTHAQVAASPLIRARASLLARACGSVGSPQIRNVATLAGNVVNALPAADGAVALFALNAQVQVASLDGPIWMPIAEMYENVGVCTIDPCVQMVTAIRFKPLSPSAGSDFQRLARRRALVLPILNVGVVVEAVDQVITDARIAVGPVAPTPFRATRAEQALIDKPVSDEAIADAAGLAMADANPRSSLLRGSQEYRAAMVDVLVRRALDNALRAGKEAQ